MAKKDFELKILLIGEALDHYGIVASYWRAFQKLGIHAQTFDPRTEIYRGFLRKLPTENDRLIARSSRLITNQFLQISSSRSLRRAIVSRKLGTPDLIVIFKCPWLRPKMLKDLKENTKSIVFHFNADSPFDMPKGKIFRNIRGNYHPNLIKTIPFYDCYFTWNKKLILDIYDVGAKHVEYLPFAWDPEIHKPAEFAQEYTSDIGSDIGFIGNWSPEREKWLSFVSNENLKIWGAYLWERATSKVVKTKWTHYEPFGEELARIVRFTKVNINFLRDQNKGSHNMRTFEIPGCAGFLLTERSKEQLEFFEEDKEIACFSKPEELIGKIKYYLSRDNLRSKMTEAAHRKVLHGHTYLDRAKSMLKVYKRMTG